MITRDTLTKYVNKKRRELHRTSINYIVTGYTEAGNRDAYFSEALWRMAMDLCLPIEHLPEDKERS